MNYLNRFKQISDEAATALYGLVKSMIDKNTTGILEVGTMAGQVTVQLAAAAAEISGHGQYAVRVVSIDQNYDSFSPTAKQSLEASNLFNTSVYEGEIHKRFEELIIKSNIIYIDRFHKVIDAKMELIKRNVIIPTKVIYRNPKNSGKFPFEVSEIIPQIRPRARKKIADESITATTSDVRALNSTTATIKSTAKKTKKETKKETI